MARARARATFWQVRERGGRAQVPPRIDRAGAQNRRVPLGISTRLFARHRFDPAWSARLRKLGYEHLELFAAEPHLPYRDPKAVTDLRAALEDAGLAPTAVQLPWFESLDALGRGELLSVIDADDARREKAFCEAELALEAAADLGATLAVLRLGEPGDQADEARRVLVEEAIARISGHASPRGIEVALENVGSALTRVGALLESIEIVGRSLVGVCVDVATAIESGEGLGALREAGRELVHVQASEPVAGTRAIPGSGACDWTEVRRVLDEVGYEGFVSVEADTANGDLEAAFDAARRAAESLR